MNIGIDGNEANQLNRVGVGQFAYNVICQLEKLDKKNQYRVYLKNPVRADLPQERDGWRYQIIGPSKIWTQIALPLKLFTQKDKLAVFYSPSHYAPRFSPFPTVISIMDLWHHRHPEQFNKQDLHQLINWERYSVEQASKIITISEFSKREIQHFYPNFKGEIVVAYPGYIKFRISNFKFQIKKLKKRYHIQGDYLLYLGTLQPKKNIEGLIRAFSILNTKYLIPNTVLVIAGKKGWQYERIDRLVLELGLGDQVIFTGFIGEEEKPYLIKGAKTFVLPSFYEGFGIPVVEAMSLGVPVVLSQEGSLPEVGGKSALYFDPYQPESIAASLKQGLGLNKEQRGEIIKQGEQWVKRFTWEGCARAIQEALTSFA